ncbi:MAG TPA: OmpA family protein [Allosphingosinicella sp.]|jgi:peptidoglycan-associated lipoprotein
MIRNSLRILSISAALVFSAGCAMSAPRRAAQQVPQPPPVPTRADFLLSVPSELVLFDEGGFSLDAQDRAVLDAQAVWLQRNPGAAVTIEGHSDERGTRDYALALADRRANAVAAYLQSRGISGSRMSVVSWGKERPVGLGSDELSWARNRRAVTLIQQ